MERNEIIAPERYIMRRTAPIVTTQTEAGNAAVLGTSTLFEVNDRLFLITAGHLFENADLRLLAIPENPMGGELWTLGDFTQTGTRDDYLDVAVLEIISEETRTRLWSGWDTVKLPCVGVASSSGTFVLSGYPFELTISTPEVLRGKLLSIYTHRLQSIPSNADKPVQSQIEIFFSCEDYFESLDGRRATLSELEGTSGASVWQVHETPPGELWSPKVLNATPEISRL